MKLSHRSLLLLLVLFLSGCTLLSGERGDAPCDESTPPGHDFLAEVVDPILVAAGGAGPAREEVRV